MPSDTEWHHIVDIHVYLYINDKCLKNENYQLIHKFKQYMPTLLEIEALKSIIKDYIHNLITQKYKNIVLLPPKEHTYVWDTKVNKE